MAVNSKKICIFFVFISAAAGIFLISKDAKEYKNSALEKKRQNEIKAAIDTAERRAESARALYMTHNVAAGLDSAAKTKRNKLLSLIEQNSANQILGKEIIYKPNAVVIDIKEVEGAALNQNIADLMTELKAKNVWTIARMVLFADQSQTEAHPQWYLQSKNGKIWRNGKNIPWLNPKNEEVKNYLVEIALQAVKAGFQEIQFDYVRFPSDGNMSSLLYPDYARDAEQRINIVNEFLQDIYNALKTAKSDIIVSADIFGYITIHGRDKIIGQDIAGMSKNLDFISPMVYPSHFYSGFYAKADEKRALPELLYGYKTALEKDVVNHPYEVVFRSIAAAQDILSAASSTAKIRPWLQDFNLQSDAKRGIVYAEKFVRDQIKASSDIKSQGWMLWNSKNEYTKEALE